MFLSPSLSLKLIKTFPQVRIKKKSKKKKKKKAVYPEWTQLYETPMSGSKAISLDFLFGGLGLIDRKAIKITLGR